MSIAEGHVFGLISSRRRCINVWPKVSDYEDKGLLRIKVADGRMSNVHFINIITVNLHL